MRRIAMVLKSSEAAAVRRAVTAAGASLIIVTPFTRPNGTVNLGMWYCAGASSGAERPRESDNPVRLEVVAEDDSSNNVVSAMLAHARAGGIENIIPFPSGKQAQVVLPESVRQAAHG